MLHLQRYGLPALSKKEAEVGVAEFGNGGAVAEAWLVELSFAPADEMALGLQSGRVVRQASLQALHGCLCRAGPSQAGNLYRPML